VLWRIFFSVSDSLVLGKLIGSAASAAADWALAEDCSGDMNGLGRLMKGWHRAARFICHQGHTL